jgi:hypothetical protein
MVNDMEKLGQVIGSLEEQAEQVAEFNGILASVDEARSEIESSKTILQETSDGYKQLSAAIDSKLDGLLKALEVINLRLANLEQKQDNCLQKIQDLKFLTPENYEDGRKASEATINDSVRSLEQKIDKANQAHMASLKVIKIFSIFGTLFLAGSIAFLASN